MDTPYKDFMVSLSDADANATSRDFVGDVKVARVRAVGLGKQNNESTCGSGG